ncbi:putative Short-chain dehydrogenase [Venustampulla echinocandica]|uniref:Putative Short-chain dehydrogenase n=1 Tax=Venustampulla echinocandica TaxID=2656787 RepID=A0A370TWX3_9HELO|nr:putative Short-chain dehydrogenase [Venustampulla echinocandica]RDL39978.1 putative Short-chain dehydrogenase [Venustampulla echinocandica]
MKMNPVSGPNQYNTKWIRNILQIQLKSLRTKHFYSPSHINSDFIISKSPVKTPLPFFIKPYQAPKRLKSHALRKIFTSKTIKTMSRKSVFITGCSEGGIGEALAKEFHRNGHRVFATARNLAKVGPLRSLGLEIVKLDVVDSESIKQAVESVQKATGGSLDFLINNSGRVYGLPLLDSDLSEAKKLFDVNGTIVNIGSVAGKFPMMWQGYYNATKAAANMLTDQLRMELSPFGVNVIQVITAGVKTRIFDNMPSAKLPESSLYALAQDIMDSTTVVAVVERDGMDVDEYARAVVANLLTSNPKKNHWVGGSVWKVWIISHSWETIWDTYLPMLFRLPEITKLLQATKKAPKRVAR